MRLDAHDVVPRITKETFALRTTLDVIFSESSLTRLYNGPVLHLGIDGLRAQSPKHYPLGTETNGTVYFPDTHPNFPDGVLTYNHPGAVP